MSAKSIQIRGAREHNLKNIDVEIPRDQLVVITGLSGSGKSTLAFDTIFAEGQRKYMESLSTYARQFLDQLQKPELDEIEGLPPTIAIEQRHASSNPRSTVATTTEIYDYLRVLFARAGTPHCWKCGRVIASQSASQIVDSVMRYPAGSKLMILSPLIRGQKGEHKDTFGALHKQGFVRARVDGEILELTTPANFPALKKTFAQAIEAWRKNGKRMNIYYSRILRTFARDFGASYTQPYKDIPKKVRDVLMYGTAAKGDNGTGSEFEGVIPNLQRRFESTESEWVKARLHQGMSEHQCETCCGTWL